MKKVLSFVLILALVLGSFSFAFGLTDITEADANSEAITVANDLGIVTGYEDGSFQAEKAVNRAEFAAMITRALAVPESALAGFSATSFKDTAGYGWAVPYLAFCESKGIMIGDGQGNVMPGRTINVNEAITMAVRSLGYTENSAVLVGTWPSKYVTVAQDLGLYDDVADMATVNRGSAAQVIYNALTVQKVQVDADGATTGLTKMVAGVSTAVTMLTSGLGAEEKTAKVIKGDESSAINLAKYKGAFVVPYEKDGEIVAIGEVKSNFLTGTLNAAGTKFTADDVDYTNKTISANLENEDPTYLFYNGVDDVALDLTAFGPYANGDTITISVELDNKNIDTLYSVFVWDYSVQGTAGLFEDGDLDGDSLMAQDFALDDDDNIDLDSFVLEGVKSLDDIAVDNVVYVYTDGTEITKVAVGTETVTGLVERLLSNGDVVIDGTTYVAAATVASFPAAVGVEGTLYLDANGDGYSWDVSVASAENYAMIVGDLDKPARDETIVLFDKEGVEDEYIVVDTAAIPAVLPGVFVADEIVEFALDKNGKIDDLNLVTKTQVGVASGLSDSRAIFAGRVVDDGVVVFVYNGAGDYEVGNIESIETGNLAGAAAANTWYFADATTGKVEVIVIDATAYGDADTVYGVLNEIQMAYVDGDDVNYLMGFADGKAFTAYTDGKDWAAAEKVDNTNTYGLSSFKLDADGVVTDVSNNVAGNLAALSGVLQARSGNSVQVGVGSPFVALDPNVVVYVYDTTAGKDDGERYSVGSLASLKVSAGTLHLYQVDSDSETYDFVIYVK